jgi:hypothetical protein
MKEKEARELMAEVQAIFEEGKSLVRQGTMLQKNAKSISDFVRRESPTRYWFEFPQPAFAVPKEIVELCETGVLKDISWQNDVLPSFELPQEQLPPLRIWVHPLDVDDREEPTCPRFMVEEPISYDQHQDGPGAEIVLQTDELEKLLEFIKTRK